MRKGETPARVCQAVGVVHGVGDSDAFAPEGDRLLEVAALGEGPGEVGAGDRRGEPVQPEALPDQIAPERPHRAPEMLGGPAEVPQGDTGSAEVEIGPDLERKVAKRQGDGVGALPGSTRVLRPSGHEEVVADCDGHPGEPPLIVQRAGQALDLGQVAEAPLELSQHEERRLELEAEIDGLLQGFPALREALQGFQGLLEACHCLAVGGA